MYYQIALIFYLASEISGKFEIFPQVRNFIQSGENEICKLESDIYRKNLENYTIWAHKMLDSSAKGAFGVLRGNEYQLGNYEECVNSNGPFPTQYCLVGITVNVPPQNSTDCNHRNHYETVFKKLERYKTDYVKFGMCFPSTCTSSDIQTSLTESLNKIENPFKAVGITYTVSSYKEFCSDYVNPKRFGPLETTFCILTVSLLIFSLIGTMGDCLGSTEENPNKFCFAFKKFCLTFSMQRNWNELFKASGHQEETKIFNGIRSISVIIIFFAHFAAFVAFIPSLNNLPIDEIINSNARMALEKIDLVVEIFFLMSGLLLVHGILKKWKTVDVNPIWLIFLRYIRLTPLNLYVSLYFATMLPYFGSGPLWSLNYTLFESCVKNNNWWLNIFYINNFMTDSKEACNEVNWYVSCDFQLFIVGVLLMFIMRKNLRLGYAILGFLFILSIIATFTITKIYEIVPNMDTLASEQYKLYWNNYYVKPYTRASSYFLGMLGGIIYDKLKSKEVKVSKMTSYAVIGMSLLLMVASYTYLIFLYNGQENYMFEFALYNTLHRPIWSIGVLGICIVTSFGSIPAIRNFLSSPFWTPFAKLTYGLYLIHMIVQFATIATSTTASRSDIFTMMSLFLALLGLSFIISSFLYIIVEEPFIQTFKAITTPKFYGKPLIVIEESATVEGDAVPQT